MTETYTEMLTYDHTCAPYSSCKQFQLLMPKLTIFFYKSQFYNVPSFKALLSDVVRGKELTGCFFWRSRDRLDMNSTRTAMRHQYWNHLDGKNIDFDTVLGLTGATKFVTDSKDVDYGISGLGGVCGDGER